MKGRDERSCAAAAGEVTQSPAFHSQLSATPRQARREPLWIADDARFPLEAVSIPPHYQVSVVPRRLALAHSASFAPDTPVATPP
jgi:hypothetical protein